MDKLKDKLKAAAIVLAAVEGDKVQIAAGVTKAETAKVKAGELVNFVAQQVGGKGGGKPDMAMAGGTDAAAMPLRWRACRPGWPSGCDAHAAPDPGRPAAGGGTARRPGAERGSPWPASRALPPWQVPTCKARPGIWPPCAGAPCWSTSGPPGAPPARRKCPPCRPWPSWKASGWRCWP
jgi:hypothetical protein